MSNSAFITKVTTHKPPRLMLTFLGSIEAMVYDQSKTNWDNHVHAARSFVDAYLPADAVSSIVSSTLTEAEVVHILVPDPRYINNPNQGDNTVHSDEKETT